MTSPKRLAKIAGVVAAFVAACRAAVLSDRTVEFYLEGLNSYRAFAGVDERDLTLADVNLGIARAWLADFVERGRKPARFPLETPGRRHPNLSGGC